MKDNFVMGLIVGIIAVFAYKVFSENINPVIQVPTPTSAPQIAPTNPVVAPPAEPTWTPFFVPTPIPPSFTPSPTLDSNPWNNITPEAGLATKVP